MKNSLLWAPWRIKYITKKKQDGCIFCRAKKGSSTDLVLIKSESAISMLNAYPYNNGHTMVFPVRHMNDIDKLTEKEIVDIFSMIKKIKEALKKLLKPHGFNIGMNISRSAGAGITGHIHFHIVPRWRGDNNFMPVLSDTKIISQSLSELHKQLIKCLIKD